MRRYADPVEVRQGPLDDDARGLGAQGATEGPQQFLWHGRLWKVRAVLAHWVETSPWWQSTGARAAIGSEEPAAEPAEPRAGAAAPVPGRPADRARALARGGRPGRLTPEGDPDGGGVFDLSFDWADGRWTLVGCTD